MKFLFLATGIASLIAIMNLPFAFYELLRWLVTIASIALIVKSTEEGKRGWLLLAIPALVLWNPFFGATMAKSSWLIFNLVAGVGFLAAARDDKVSN